MEQQMDQTLILQPFDPVVFQRVWKRVMPDDKHSPIQLVPLPKAPPSAVEEVGQSLVPEEHTLCFVTSSAQVCQSLKDWVQDLQGAVRSYQNLARRPGFRWGRSLHTLVEALQHTIKRLSTAYFLMTGEQMEMGVPQTMERPSSLPVTLRTLFFQEQRRQQEGKQWIEQLRDPCLISLVEEICQEASDRRDMIRRWLEQL